MNFVNDVNFVRRIGGRVFARFAQFADLFDAVVAGAVNFEHVERTAFSDFNAAGIGVVEVNFGSAGAIQRLGKNAGDGGFAGAARAAKKIRVCDALLRDGVAERLGDVLLADDIGEALRAIFAGNDLI